MPRPELSKIVELIQTGEQAPTAGNSKPFHFQWERETLRITTIADRARSFLNHADSMTWLSLGIVMEEIGVAAAGRGVDVSEALPSTESPGVELRFHSHLARVHPLAGAQRNRVTDRRPYNAKPLTENERRWLEQAAGGEPGVKVTLLNNRLAIDGTARGLSRFDEILFCHREVRESVFRWIRWRRVTQGETGIPLSELGLKQWEVVFLRYLSSRGGMESVTARLGGRAAASAENRFRASGALGFITVEERTPVSLIRAGRAFDRLWLAATAFGISLQPLSGLPLLEMRRRAGGLGLDIKTLKLLETAQRDLLPWVPIYGTHWPVMAFRVGYPVSPRANPLSVPAGVESFQWGKVASGAKSLPAEPIPSTSLPPAHHFWESAFDRMLGAVTEKELHALADCRVAIPGLGGVGGIHLITLTRAGVGKFNVADKDTFEIANFNRQYGARIDTLSQEKVGVMCKEALGINPHLDLRAFPGGVTEENLDAFLDGVHVVVDGLDFFAWKIRRRVFNRARERGIPVVTAGPIGFGTTLLVFSPTGMGFDEYFDIHDDTPDEEAALRFYMGISPSLAHMEYAVDVGRIRLDEKKGPSLSVGCVMAAGAAGAEALRWLLARPGGRVVPHSLQFDPYLGRVYHRWLPFGNRGPGQRVKLAIARRKLARMRA